MAAVFSMYIITIIQQFAFTFLLYALDYFCLSSIFILFSIIIGVLIGLLTSPVQDLNQWIGMRERSLQAIIKINRYIRFDLVEKLRAIDKRWFISYA